MSDTILGGDFRVYYSGENNQKRIEWSGSSDGTRTLNELYSALQSLFDDASQMDDEIPIKFDTPDIYRTQNEWFIDDTSVEHLTGGSLFSEAWQDGTTEHVLVIGYAQTTEFDVADIGRTIRGATTSDTGTILDFNTTRNLVWIRPVNPVSGGDEFDNGLESYSIGAAVNGDAVGQATQEDNDGGPSFVDETLDANGAAANDVDCFPATSASNDAFYLGFEATFSKVIVDRLGGTQGVGGVTAYEYWNGTAWTALSGVSDDTATGGGLGNAAVADTDEITFTVPSDWALTSVDSGAQLYFIRFRVTTIYSTEPIFDQVFISGLGAGAFAAHGRHGIASAAGESAWAGITTIGAIEPNTHLSVFQQSPEGFDSSSETRETRLVATKGTADWWGDGQLDILVKVKEADSIFGRLPASSPVTSIITVFARQYSKLYSHFIATALATAGGNTVVPLSAGDDLDNPLGYRNLIWDLGSSDTLVDEELLYNVGALGAGNLDAGVQDDGGTFTDDTTDVNDVGTGDVEVFPATEAINDAFYFGKDNIFTFLMVDIGTQGVSSAGATIWEYFDGTTWQTLTVTDDSDTGNGAFTDVTGRHLISWTAPSDWARTNITNQPATAPTDLFYVRVRITAANYSTVPVLDTCWVGGELQLKARVADTTLTTPGGATGNGDYYLIGDPLTDFVNDDVVIAGTSRKTFDINGGPTNVGPALDTAITITFGQTTEDINNGNGARPYSVRINPASLTMARIYERMKFVTRRGSVEALTIGDHVQDGEEYIGDELQIEYNTQAGGNFIQGQMVFDQTADGVGIIVADHDDGATGDVILRALRGTFAAGNVLSDATSPAITLQAALQEDASPAGFVDQTAAALSAGGADVNPYPAAEASGDAFYVGADDVFGTINIDIATSATGAPVVVWEYWDGSSWTDLSVAHNLTDGTAAWTAATGFQTVTFNVPSDWVARTVGLGSVVFGSHYYIRARLTTGFTVDPVLDEVQLLDFITATIGSIRTIAPVPAAPFGAKAGTSVFFAPGVAITSANVFAGEEQLYQLIDDNGVVQTPPNTVSIVVDNLVSGDTVFAARRTGTAVNKTQFTLAASNDVGNTTVVVNEAIAADNPTIANSKVRVISGSGDEHRYRYDSYATSTFTLSPASTGAADGANSSNTRLHDTTGTFVTDEVEVGDYVRNTTQGEFVRVTNVISNFELDTEALSGVSQWDGDSYSLNTLVENYVLNDNAYVPFIERIADATSESNQLVQSSSIDILVNVRNAGVIVPFTNVTAAIGSTGVTVTTIRTADSVFT